MQETAAKIVCSKIFSLGNLKTFYGFENVEGEISRNYIQKQCQKKFFYYFFIIIMHTAEHRKNGKF